MNPPPTLSDSAKIPKSPAALPQKDIHQGKEGKEKKSRHKLDLDSNHARTHTRTHVTTHAYSIPIYSSTNKEIGHLGRSTSDADCRPGLWKHANIDLMRPGRRTRYQQ
ncbi:hypothetical protein EYC84_007638 [Monilinia fructicola]|uniref:Uncharacterized protein n=1 Tax=Monilinia fructicola TaxID=38448 RepID=A0A5M9JIS7_MONFR|nr:hypothetical protein EYC84_007638 [Monilinia fructicola]